MPNFKIVKREVKMVSYMTEVTAVDKEAAEKLVESLTLTDWETIGGSESSNVSVRKVKPKAVKE